MKYKKSRMIGVIVLLLIGGVVVAYMMIKSKNKTSSKKSGQKVGQSDLGSCCGANFKQDSYFQATGVCTGGSGVPGDPYNMFCPPVTGVCAGSCCEGEAGFKDCIALQNSGSKYCSGLVPSQKADSGDGHCCGPDVDIDKNGKCCNPYVDTTTGNCCNPGELVDAFGDCCDPNSYSSGPNYGCCSHAGWKANPILCYMGPCNYLADSPANKCCVTDESCISKACNNIATCMKNAVTKYCKQIGQYPANGECCDFSQQATSGIDSIGNCCDINNPTMYGCCSPTDWSNHEPWCQEY